APRPGLARVAGPRRLDDARRRVPVGGARRPPSLRPAALLPLRHLVRGPVVRWPVGRSAVGTGLGCVHDQLLPLLGPPRRATLRQPTTAAAPRPVARDPAG